jgi:hypothetical protein
MDHSKRDKIPGPNVGITVSVLEIEDGLNINIKTDGCDRVPLKIEMCVSSGTNIKSDAFICEGTAGGAVTIASGNTKVSNGVDTIEIGPAFAKHNLVSGYAGSEGRSKNHFTIFFTDFTNFDHTITLRKTTLA